MELHQLRYFVATAEAGGVSRAAGRCRVAQPSLSQQIMKLEAGLGTALFDRQGRGMTLTDAGRALLPRARRILAEVQDAEENLGRDVSRGVGRVSIGAIPTMAPYLLPRAIERLRKELPGCEVSVREDLTGSVIEALHDGRIDCALVSTPIADELIDVEVLGREELLVVAPAGWAGGDAGLLSIGDLRDQPAVLLEEIHCLGEQVQAFCTARRVAPRIVCRTTQLMTILELVGLGLGISIIPAMAAAGDSSSARRYYRLRTSRPEREIAMAWRKGRSRPMAAERFSQIVRGIVEAGFAAPEGVG